MCGRFTQAYTWEQLVALYRLTMPPVNTQPSYNVCPTDQIDLVMLDQDAGRAFTRARWGLIPYWWSKPLKQLPATFNARSDGVATKPMFRDAFKKRRCIVPMSGFYEWRQMEDGKQPFFISAIDGGVLSCAGLWDTWNDREKGERIRSATLIVTEANPFMSTDPRSNACLPAAQQIRRMAGRQRRCRDADAFAAGNAASLAGVAAGQQLEGGER